MSDKKTEPVESPNDWVELDPVVYADFELRKGIDFINYGHGWDPVDGYDGCTIAEFMIAKTNQVRCRRSDLPPMPQEAPKRDYVRCFTTLEGTVLTAKDISEFDMPKLWHELKHDGTGFYLEDGK